MPFKYIYIYIIRALLLRINQRVYLVPGYDGIIERKFLPNFIAKKLINETIRCTIGKYNCKKE